MLQLCGTEHPDAHAQVIQYNNSERQYHEGCYDRADDLNAFLPFEVVESHGGH